MSQKSRLRAKVYRASHGVRIMETGPRVTLVRAVSQGSRDCCMGINLLYRRNSFSSPDISIPVVSRTGN